VIPASVACVSNRFVDAAEIVISEVESKRSF